jgi:hypothetical protein
LVSAEDGSKHTARTFGEAMDSGDKATNKAMSAAYKYMAFQTFAIPTEGDNDADNHTHEIVRTQVSSSTMQALIADIAACTTEDELKDAYFHAISKAGNDQAAKTAIIKAKDAKKGELK